MYDHGRFAPFYSIQPGCETRVYPFTLVHSVVSAEFFPQYILHDLGRQSIKSSKFASSELVTTSASGIYCCELSRGWEKYKVRGVLQNLLNAEVHMETLMLNETEVQRLLDPDMLLDALAEGFKALSEGLVDAPKRNGVSVPNTGFLLSMPAYQHGREI